MADKDIAAGMATTERHVYGPRTVSSLLPRITRAAFRRHSPAAVQLLADWPDIIGPALAAVTTPRRLVSGTLTLACAGPIAIELQHLSTELMARINGHLGKQVVQRLQFSQAIVAPEPAHTVHRPDPSMTKAAAAAVAHLPSGPLRDALAALGRAVLEQASTKTTKSS